MNLNDEVKIKITPFGRECLQKNHEDIYGFAAQTMKVYQPKEDADGYVTMQLWCVMYEFGRHMCNGGPVPIETEIVLK